MQKQQESILVRLIAFFAVRRRRRRSVGSVRTGNRLTVVYPLDRTGSQHCNAGIISIFHFPYKLNDKISHKKLLAGIYLFFCQNRLQNQRNFILFLEKSEFARTTSCTKPLCGGFFYLIPF